MNKSNQESGSILVVVLLLASALTAMGLSAGSIARTGEKMYGSFRTRQAGLYAADGAIQLARKILLDHEDSWDKILKGETCATSPQPPTANPHHGFPICDPDDNIPMQDVALIPPTSQTYAKVSPKRPLSFSIWVRNDDNEWRFCNGKVEPGETADDGDCDGDGTPEDDDWRNTTEQDGRVLVHIEAKDNKGRVVAAMEAIIVRIGGNGGSMCYWQRGGCNGQNTNSATVSIN